jgi:hypothetical protein
VGEEWVALGGGKGGGFACPGDFIIAACGALVGGGDVVGLPLGFDKLIALEAAERGIYGAAGQAGDLHDIEAEAVAEAEGLEDEGGAVGKARRVHGLCSMLSQVVCYIAENGESI